LLNLIAGKPVVAEDGRAGPATSLALRTFQQSQGLSPTGMPDAQTSALLMRLAHAGVSFPEPGTQAAQTSAPAPDATSEGGKVLPLTPWWQSPELLADKQGLSGGAREAFDALSHDSQQSLAWQSLTTGRSMESILLGR
jgi:hypothetical protein